MASQVCLITILALFLISTMSPFANAAEERNCDTMQKKKLGDCDSSEPGAEECKAVYGLGWFYKAIMKYQRCMGIQCAKKCRALGGDELITSDYEKYMCCQSQTPEQKDNVAKGKGSCTFEGCFLLTHEWVNPA